MYKSGDKICHVNNGSFWFAEIIENKIDGIICNIVGFQNKNLNIIKTNYFIKKETQLLDNYILVTPELEKEMMRIIYEIK